jgi:hypothetical protein
VTTEVWVLSEEFWWWYVTSSITGLLGFVHFLVFVCDVVPCSLMEVN